MGRDRARRDAARQLLNAIVGDIYGPQTLLHSGLLPPALVFGHPGYLRSVKGFVPPGGQYLQLVAVDLARPRTAHGRSWRIGPRRLPVLATRWRTVPDRFERVRRALSFPARKPLAPTYSQLIATLVQAAAR